MTLAEAYRLALARGLTAKQAGAEFNMRWDSIAKQKAKLKLPSLVSELECYKRKGFESMSTKDLGSFLNCLVKNGMQMHKDYKYASEEYAKRTTQA